MNMEDFKLFSSRSRDCHIQTLFIPHIGVKLPDYAVQPSPTELLTEKHRYYYQRGSEDKTPIYTTEIQNEQKSQYKCISSKNTEVNKFKGKLLVRQSSIHARESSSTVDVHKKAKQAKRKSDQSYMKSNFISYCGYLRGEVVPP